MITNINTSHVRHHRSGVLMLDALISMFVVGMMILVFSSLIGSLDTSRHIRFRAEAAALADQEIDALKQMDVTALSNQTSGSFLGVMQNGGAWSIGTDAANLDVASNPCPPAASGSHCGSNVLTIPGSTAFPNSASGRLLFPAGGYSTATLQANWKVMGDSPSAWAIGYWVQATDAKNGYRIRWAATSTDLDSGTSGTQNLVFEKVSNGTVSTLWSKSNVAISTNTWNTLKVVLNPTGAATVKIYTNSTAQDADAITDTSFTKGQAALLAWGGVHAEVDDVVTTASQTNRWSFEGSTTLPVAWLRLSLNDLPDGTSALDDNGLLTLSSYPNANSTSLKQAQITIRWQQAGGVASYTNTVLIGRSGVGL